MTEPVPTLGLPEHDTIASAGHAAHSMQAPVPTLEQMSWLGAVWLAPDACLIHSHLRPVSTEQMVVQVVGVADQGDWTGAVLILD